MPAPIVSRAFDAALDEGGAALRRVRIDGEEVFRAIALVVRDDLWRTPDLHGDVRRARDGATETVDASGRLAMENGALEWSVRWRFEPGGLSVACEASAARPVRTNRTGLVLLHSLPACRGRTVTVMHPDGARTERAFPRLVAPHQPLLDIAALRFRTEGGTWLDLRFEGEVFETEDQRNWTDASYKTYGRPLAQPFPYEIGPGAAVAQRLTVRWEPRAMPVGGVVRDASGCEIGPALRCPEIGVSVPPDAPASAATAAALAALAPTFTSIEVEPARSDWAGRAEACLGLVRGLVRVDWRPGADPADLETLLRLLEGRDQSSLTLWDAPQETLDRVRSTCPHLRVGGGTGGFFTQLNRMELLPDADYLTWTTTPTVHAGGDDMFGETLEPLPDLLATIGARTRTPLQVGPLTLGMRYDPETRDPRQRRPAPPDPRLGSEIHASWLLGTLAGLLDGQVRAVVFGDLPEGLIRTHGGLTAAGHLAATLARCAGSPVSRISWPGHPRCMGLLFEREGRREALVTFAADEEEGGALPFAARSAERLTSSGFEAVSLPGRIPGRFTFMRLRD